MKGNERKKGKKSHFASPHLFRTLENMFIFILGKNVIGISHTGSGKTAAFAIPILDKLAEDPFAMFALVLSPTR
jgi:superfamily II DNA/RNA helicase